MADRSSQPGGAAPPALPPRPGGRTSKPVLAPPEAIYDDCSEENGIPPDPDDVYDDCEEKAAAPPLPPPPPPELVYDDCDVDQPASPPPPPPERPHAGRPLQPLAAPQGTSDTDGPIVQHIPKRQLPPPPPVHSPPPAIAPGYSVYELSGDEDDEVPQNECLLPPPPPSHADPEAIYEVEPDVEEERALPVPASAPQLPPKSHLPPKLPPQPSKPLASPGPKKPAAGSGFSMDLGQLQNVKKGLRKVSLEITPDCRQDSHDTKVYGDRPQTVYDAKKVFESKADGKPVPPKQSSMDKVHGSTPLPPVPPLYQLPKPVCKVEPKQVELEDPEDIYDDASSALPDLLAKYDWYHGFIDRTTGEKRIKAVAKDGTFLVRVSEKDPKYPFTLVVFHSGQVNNLRIRKRPDSKVALGDEKSGELAFEDVPAMIGHHQKHNVVLLGNSQTQVKLQHMAPKK